MKPRSVRSKHAYRLEYELKSIDRNFTVTGIIEYRIIRFKPPPPHFAEGRDHNALYIISSWL